MIQKKITLRTTCVLINLCPSMVPFPNAGKYGPKNSKYGHFSRIALYLFIWILQILQEHTEIF